MEPKNGRFVRLPELMSIVGLRRSAVYSRCADGRMPPPCHRGRAAVWLSDEIDEWIRRVRDDGEPPVGPFPPRTLNAPAQPTQSGRSGPYPA